MKIFASKTFEKDKVIIAIDLISVRRLCLGGIKNLVIR